jgi:hypothetical protein
LILSDDNLLFGGMTAGAVLGAVLGSRKGAIGAGAGALAGIVAASILARKCRKPASYHSTYVQTVPRVSRTAGRDGVKCGSCGKMNGKERFYCAYCGKVLEEGDN